MNYKEALKIAEELNDKLELHSFIVNDKYRIISFLHVDGTYCQFNSACFREIDKDWIAIFTEHHGHFVYNKEDLQWVKESLTSDILYYNCNKLYNN